MSKHQMIRCGTYLLPVTEFDRRTRSRCPCARCGGPRYFADRLRDNGLCSPCTRAEAESKS